MIAITGHAIAALQRACREIGEDHVSVATDAGVISFDFASPHEIRGKALTFDSQPTRVQLAAMLGLRPISNQPSTP